MANPEQREGGGPSRDVVEVADTVRTQLEQISSPEDASRFVHEIISQLQGKYGPHRSSWRSGSERSQGIFSLIKEIPEIGKIQFSLTQPLCTDYCVLNMSFLSGESAPGARKKFISTLLPTDQEYFGISPGDFD